MATTDKALAQQVRDVIKARLDGGGYEEYGTGLRQWRGASLLELRKLLKDLENGSIDRPAVLIQDVAA